MDRLTERIEGKVCLHRGNEWGSRAEYQLQIDARERLAAYEDTGLTPERIHELISIDRWNDAVEQEWLKYLQAEKEKRLIILPCKVTDTVYAIESIYNGRKYAGEKVVSARIDHVTIGGTTGEPVFDLCTETGGWFYSMEPGQFFLTREEAEKALEEGRAGNEAD